MTIETRARGVVLREFNAPLAIESAPVPEPGPGAVIAAVELAGVCGTDVHLHHGNLPIPPPVILGHEAVGRVRSLGEGVRADFTGDPLREGDAIAWSSNIPCGRCYWCVVAGERTLCETRKVYGVNQRFDEFPRLSGGWAESIYLQPGSAIFRLPDGVTPEQAIALGCAGPTAVHGVLDVAGITAGDTVVVQGSGPVGIAAAMYAHLAGAARVILVGGPAGRLELAREIGVGDVHIDIFAFPDPGGARAAGARRDPRPARRRRGAGVRRGAGGGRRRVRDGPPRRPFLVLGQYTDRGPIPLNPHVITRKQLASSAPGPSPRSTTSATSGAAAARRPLRPAAPHHPLPAGRRQPGAGRHGRRPRHEAGAGRESGVVSRQSSVRRQDGKTARRQGRAYADS